MPNITLSTGIQQLLPENRLRKSFVVQNEDATINVFIKKEKPGQDTVSATDHDHRLGPGNAIAINNNTDGKEAIEARWTIIAASGTPLASFFETEENRR